MLTDFLQETDLETSIPHPQKGLLGQILRLLQVPDSAKIQVAWYPDNLVADRGSRLREGGIEADQGALLDKTRCTKDGLAPKSGTGKKGEADSAIGMFPNDISWGRQTENTSIWPERGAV
jgi:hypothetical protein